MPPAIMTLPASHNPVRRPPSVLEQASFLVHEFLKGEWQHADQRSTSRESASLKLIFRWENGTQWPLVLQGFALKQNMFFEGTK